MTKTLSTPPVNPTATPAPSVAEQKCNYCGGSGKWTKDILPGKPPESVNCPHCHGSGKLGHTTVEEVPAEPSA